MNFVTLCYFTLQYITLHCIAFPWFIVSQNHSRMWNMSYKWKTICTVQLKFTQKKTQENTVVTHEAIQKYIHIYTSILSTYAIYTTITRESSVNSLWFSIYSILSWFINIINAKEINPYHLHVSFVGELLTSPSVSFKFSY
jgi:hypothetical protein